MPENPITVPFGILDRRQAEGDLDPSPVLGDAFGVEWLDIFPAPQPLVHRPEFVAAIRWHDDLDRLTCDFMSRIAVHHGGGGVPTRDFEFRRHADDRVERGIHDGGDARQISVGKAQGNGSGQGGVGPPAEHQQGTEVQEHHSRHRQVRGVAHGGEPQGEGQDRRYEIGKERRQVCGESDRGPRAHAAEHECQDDFVDRGAGHEKQRASSAPEYTARA
jgi:hypothetical protein